MALVDSSFLWIGLVAAFVMVLVPVGMHNSESAFLDRAERYGTTLEEINRKGLLYQKQERQEEFEEQAELMQKNLRMAASDALNLDVTPWPDHSAYFPLRDASDIKPRSGESQEICDVGPNIPLHLHSISKTERFQLFAKKYSGHPITLDIMDERFYKSRLAYGLTAGAAEKYASIWTYVSTCTDQTAGAGSVFICRDNATGYTNVAHTEKDFAASIEHDEFCVIPLSPWRQSLLDYRQKITLEVTEMMDELVGESEKSEMTHQDMMRFHKDFQRRDLLQEVANAYYRENVEAAEEKTAQYVREYGRIPQELADMVERMPRS